MARTTIVFGVLLILLGVAGYLGDSPTAEAPAVVDREAAATDVAVEVPTGKRSVTALIPAFVGAILLLSGVVAMNEKLRMHAMHAAVLVGLLGAIAGVGRGAMGIGKFMSNDPDLNRRAFLFVWIMAILCTIFVILCVRSFIDARKRRKLAEGPAA